MAMNTTNKEQFDMPVKDLCGTCKHRDEGGYCTSEKLVENAAFQQDKKSRHIDLRLLGRR